MNIMSSSPPAIKSLHAKTKRSNHHEEDIILEKIHTKYVLLELNLHKKNFTVVCNESNWYKGDKLNVRCLFYLFCHFVSDFIATITLKVNDREEEDK